MTFGLCLIYILSWLFPVSLQELRRQFLVADQFKNLERPVDKPFRLNVSDVFKGATGGFSIAGRISAGYIRPGDKVMVMPAGNLAGVKSKTASLVWEMLGKALTSRP